MAKTFGAIFPNSHATYGQNFWSQMEVTLEKFYYFQGSHFRTTTNGNMCQPNANLEAGLDQTAEPLICAAGYDAYHEVSRCVKLNAVAVNICQHDMVSENNKCYRCQRGYGNINQGLCSKCSGNCQLCTGPNDVDCLACDERYNFDGSICKVCDLETQTYDVVTGACQSVSQHNFDLWGSPKTINNIYFKPLSGFADPLVHLENVFDKYWLNHINMNYYVIRQYNNLPNHRKVSIYLDMIIMDITYWEFVYIAIDKQYVKFLYPITGDTSTSSQLWGLSYLDWQVNVTLTAWHSASTMELELMGSFASSTTNIWVREVRVDFFGCFYTCLTCLVDNSANHCLTCITGYYINNFQCKACDQSCLTCNNQPNFCTSCAASTHLYQNQCIDTCPASYYVDAANSCQPCGSFCLSCSSNTVCLTCQNGYFVSGGSCSPCNAACSQCSNTANYCTKCSNTALFAQSGSCVASCSATYYLSGFSCLQCPTGCSSCTSSTHCTACSVGYLMQNSDCKASCDFGYYQSSPATCSACDPKCKACSGSSTFCLACPEKFYLNNNQCVPCQSPCVTCLNQNQCLSCVEPQLELNNQCVTTCPDGKFANLGRCQTCEQPCQTCTGQARNCKTCVDGYFYFKNSCLQTCLEGYSNYQNKVCCPKDCAACDTTTGKCIQCKPGKYLDSKLQTCMYCSNMCAECTETSKNCTKCAKGLYLMDSNCTTSCLVNGYYEDQSSFICKKCSANCKQCSGATEDTCLMCNDKFALYQNKCVPCGEKDSPFDLLDDNCIDRCGDGKRFSSDEVPYLASYNLCDDGNLISGDGCSSECQVERNFACFGGNDTTKDVCRENVMPSAILSKAGDTRLVVTFSENIKDWNNIDPSQYVTVKCKKMILNTNYTYTITKAEAQNQFYIDLNFLNSVLNQKVRVKFNRTRFVDYYENKLRTSQLSTTITYKIYPRLGSEGFMNVTSIILNIFTGLSATLFPISGTYLCQSSSVALGNLQRIGFNFLSNSVYQDDVDYAMLSLFKIFNFGMINPLNKTSLYLFNNSTVVTLSKGRRLEQIANGTAKGDLYFANDYLNNWLSNPDAFHLSEVPLVFMLIVSIALCSSIFFRGKFSKNVSRIKRFIMYTFSNMMIVVALFLHFPILVKSLHNMVLFSLSSVNEILIGCFSVLVFLACVLSPLFVFFATNRDLLILWHPHYYLKFGSLYSLFKLDRPITKNFFAFYLIKNSLLAILLVACINASVVQNLLMCFPIVGFGFLVIKYMPFINIYLNVMVLMSEAMEFGMHVIMIINSYLIKRHHAKMLSITSGFLHAFYIVFFILNLFIFLYILGMKIAVVVDWKKLKEKFLSKFSRSTKNQVAPGILMSKSSSRGESQYSARKSRTLEDSIGPKSEVVLNKFKSHSLDNIVSPVPELQLVGSPELSVQNQLIHEEEVAANDDLLLREDTPYNSEEDFLQAQQALLNINTKPLNIQGIDVEKEDEAYYTGYYNY